MFRKSIGFLTEAVRNPQSASRLLRSKIAPQSITNGFLEKCVLAGLNEPRFILSFDCDTDKDIRTVSDVHNRLNDMGIMPVYAVPGELLRRGEAVYSKIAKDGAEFINHGDAVHCVLDENTNIYHSSFFYDRLTRSEVRNDIVGGHRAIQEVLGVSANGFRTPHFGTYQHKDHLSYLYEVLGSLGYVFSTSTSPEFGTINGPISRHGNLIEVSMTGCPSKPLRILDSWTFRYAPNRTETETDYIRHISDMIEIVETGRPYLVNIYADPSQVYDWPEFFTSVKRMAKFNVPSYTHLLNELKNV